MTSFVSRRMAGIILAAAVALALAACSAIRLGYNALPNLAYWWLDGYVDLQDAQAANVRQQLESLLAWHRANELPRVVDFLARMERIVPGDITPPQACAFLDEARARLAAAGAHAEPDATALAMGLDPRQLRQLERKFRRNDEKYFQDWLAPSPEEQRQKLLRQMTERFEMIYGPLDEPQRAVMRARIVQVPYEPSRILAERQRWQKELLQVLRRVARPGVAPADARAQLHAWLERVQHSPDPGFRGWQEGFIQEGCRTFALVHASTTPAQREQAVQRLRGYERDLRALIAQPS